MHPVVDIIQLKVSEIYGLSREDIFSEKKNPELVEPRHIAISIANAHGDKIGIKAFIAEQFGHLTKNGEGDHSVVIYAVKKVKDSCDAYKAYKEKYEAIFLTISEAISLLDNSECEETQNESLKSLLKKNIKKLQTSPSFVPQANAINEAIRNLIELNRVAIK